MVNEDDESTWLEDKASALLSSRQLRELFPDEFDAIALASEEAGWLNGRKKPWLYRARRRAMLDSGPSLQA